jgi:sugar/nucleoside kinase (ribokinase family)
LTGRVIVVGDLVTDIVAVYSGQLAVGTDTPAQIKLTGGGAAANTAAWLASRGVPVTLVGVVGTDPAGADLVAALTALGVDCAVRRAPQAPTGSVVVLSQEDERTMLNDRGANTLLASADIDAVLGGASDAVHLHLSGYVLFDEACRPAGRHALTAARGGGLTTSVDAASAGPLREVGGAAFAEWVRGADLLFANDDEARVLPDPLDGYVRHAVNKHGDQGASWHTAGQPPVRVPAEQVRVVDVTGAGDAFAAGLLAAWLAGAGPEDALRAGARLGSRAVQASGARPVPDPATGEPGARTSAP